MSLDKPNAMSPIGVLVALASGTRYTTVSSDGEDVDDASASSNRTSAEPENILPRLKAADRSGLCCKRSIVVNQSRKIKSIMAYFWSMMAYSWSIIGINREHQSIA